MSATKRTPWIASIAAGLLILLLFAIFAHLEDLRYRETLRSEVIGKLGEIHDQLAARINTNFHLTRGLIAFVSAYPDISQKTFHRIADYLLQYDNFIRNIALAPDNVIAFVHPIKGNEGAIGLNYRTNAQQWPAIKEIIESGKSVVAGPVNLVQGGSAFICRTPIFVASNDTSQLKHYWGLASIVIDKDQLLAASGFYSPDPGIRIALRGGDGKGAQGGLIAGDPNVLQNNPVLLTVHIPDGSWQLAAIPSAGWEISSPYRPQILGGGAFATFVIGIWVFVWLQRQAQTRNQIETALKKARQAESQLQFSNSILTSQMEASLDGILVVNEQGDILSYNQRFSEIWQIPDEIIVTGDDQLTLEFALKQTVDPAAFLQKVEALYASREEKSRDLIKLKDGRLLDRYSTPLIGDNGTYFGRTWYFRDITEQTRMEQELLKMKKLESVGVLAGGIAHDFNNILAAILGNITLALRRTPDGEKSHQLLKEAEQASLRAKGLAQQLLTFSKGGAPIKQLVSLEKIIREAAELVLRGSKVRCEWEISEQLAPAEVDPGQVGQIIQNLVMNAVQAMPEGGTIRIYCGNVRIRQKTLLPLNPGDYLLITITDSGTGIPAGQLENIFDPYFTTKKSGSGLGLAVTHSIVKKHLGHIEVESTPGTGTSFRIYLPAVAGASPPEKIGAGEVQAPRPAKILIMDDEEMVRNVTRSMLVEMGHEVLLANNGREALTSYQNALKKGSPVDLCIMDLTVPGGMGGEEAVQKLLAIDPQAKVIVSSGYYNSPVMSNFQAFGFCAAIGKPPHFIELNRLIGQLLADHRQDN